MQVREVMTATPMTIDPEAPVETAVAVMRERGLRHLPVVDGDGRLIGIVTDRDLRSAMFGSALVEHLPAEQGGRLRALTATLNDVRVSHVMTWRVVTIGPGAPVAQAAAIMANVRVGSLPVVEGTRLVGIVTEHDVLKALAATLPCIRGADPDTYLW
jgi:acetoin utilization protein AcuB